MAVLKSNSAEHEVVREGMSRYKVHTDSLMTVVIDFTDGPWAEAEPPHKHPHEQTAYIASGELIFKREGEPDEHLKAGDMYYVPSDKYHTIQLLSESARIVDNFTPIREDFL